MTTIQSAKAAAEASSNSDSWPPTSLFTQVRVLTGRLLAPLRRPGTILLGLGEPLILLLLFGQVFQALANAPGMPADVKYIDYLLPAIIITMTVNGGMQSGSALTNNMNNGIINRFRAMRIHLVSVLIARSLADALRIFMQLLIMMIVGALVFDYGPAGGWAGSAGALLTAVCMGFGISWIFIGIAAKLRNPEKLQAITFMVSTPLMFASNAFVPLESLPGWLRVVAEINPMSHAITAGRGLALGTASVGTVLMTLALSVVMVVIAAPLAVREFRKV